MENKEGFKEGIESYRKRLIDELFILSSNIDGFVDARNHIYDVKHLIQIYRRSLEKCNLYLSEMEVIVEGKIKVLVDGPDQLIEVTPRDTNK